MDLKNYLNGVSHVGFVVEDVADALANIQQRFGCCSEVEPYLFSPDKAWYCGEPLEGVCLKIVMCRLSETIIYEIIQPLTPAGFHYASLMKQGDHLNHVALQTEDYEGLHKAFAQEGGKMLFEAETNDQRGGYRRCFYATLPGIPGVFEVQEKATAYRPLLAYNKTEKAGETP